MNLYETQEYIETVYNKNQKGKLIGKFIDGMEDIDNYLQGCDIKKRIFTAALQLEDCRIETIIGMVTNKPDEHHEVLDKAIELAETGLIELFLYPEKLVVKSPIHLPHELKAIIKNYMYLPPMLVPPKKLVTNRDSGYLTVVKDAVILNDRNHNYYVNLNHLNRCNAVAYSLNDRVIRSIADKAAHLNAPKPHETQDEYEQRVKAFEKFTKDSMKVFATMINSGNRFHFTHKYDHRSRTYAQGYHINYQGNCYRKAIVELADKEKLSEVRTRDFTPAEYLMIDIANNYGLDKKDYSVRLDWFKENEHQLEALIPDAKEDALFMAGVIAWRDYQAGKEIGYMCSMDATSSGIQLLSLMTRCIKTASLCNVIDIDGRRDAYAVLFDVLKEECAARNLPLGDIDHDKVKKAIMTYFYGSRRKPKELLGDDSPQLAQFYNVMKEHCTGAYNAGEFLLNIWNPNQLEYKWTLPNLFTVHAKVMVKKINKIVVGNLEIEIPTYVNEPVKKGKEYPANVTHSIDGYILSEIIARADYDVKQIERVLGALETIKYNPMVKAKGILKDFINIFGRTNMPSVAIVDYIDNSNAMCVPPLLRNVLIGILSDMLTFKPFHVTTTHDCFRCHPNNMHRVTQLYNILLGELLTGTLLDSIVTEIVGRKVALPIMQLPMNLLSQFLDAVLANKYSLT